MPPAKIGRYEILSELGRGQNSVVYRAFDPNFKREVAIKGITGETAQEHEFRIRFRQQSAVVASLEHPAIIPVYDFGEHERQPFLVLRLMKGGTLADRISLGPLALTEAARILARLAPGLDYAHRRNILHRDLKPHNILFDERNEPYLTDFEIARPDEVVAAQARAENAAYLSPEQANGESQPNLTTDIYALGVILYEMLAGRKPFNREGETLNRSLPDIQAAVPGLPNAVQLILARCLALDPGDRYRTAQQIADDLNEALAGQQPASFVAGNTPTLTVNSRSAPATTPRRAEPPALTTDDYRPTLQYNPNDPQAASRGAPRSAPRPAARPPANAAPPPTARPAAPKPAPGRNLLYIVGLLVVAALLVGAGFAARRLLAPPPTDTPAPSETQPAPASATSDQRLELTLTAVVQELNLTLTAAAPTLTPTPAPTETPTPEPTATPTPERRTVQTNFDADEGFFALNDQGFLVDGRLVMGVFSKCDLDTRPLYSAPSCLVICTACGQAANYTLEFDAAFTDGRRSDNLFGIALRFDDQNGNGRIDKEDYFLGWTYSVGIRKVELPLNDDARWYIYEHIPNQAVNPWRYVDSDRANLSNLPRNPNRIKVVSTIEIYQAPPLPTATGLQFSTPTPQPTPEPVEYLYIEVYMNDRLVTRIVNYDKAISPKQARYIPALPNEAAFGFWIAEANVQVAFDNFRYQER